MWYVVCMVCLSYVSSWSVGIWSVLIVCVGICVSRLGLDMQKPGSLRLRVQPLGPLSAGAIPGPWPFSDHSRSFMGCLPLSGS